MLVPQIGQVPFTARRFPSRVGIVSSTGFCISRIPLHVTQYALTGSIRKTMSRWGQYMLLSTGFK